MSSVRCLFFLSCSFSPTNKSKKYFFLHVFFCFMTTLTIMLTKEHEWEEITYMSCKKVYFRLKMMTTQQRKNILVLQFSFLLLYKTNFFPLFHFFASQKTFKTHSFARFCHFCFQFLSFSLLNAFVLVFLIWKFIICLLLTVLIDFKKILT